MEIIKIEEQEIINAICVFVANHKRISAEAVLVELVFEDETGFSAEVEVNGNQEIVTEPKLVEALRNWLDSEYRMDPFSVSIQLDLHDGEGIVAYIS
jgi:hypothetical protein